jgi:aspartate aminotransferase-like enzyme
MEASVVNLLKPGDKAVCVRGGKFGERWGKLCERYGVEVIAIDPTWGDPATPEDIQAALDANPDVAAVYVTLCETSTATAADVEAIGTIVAGSDACLVVDGISSVGAMECRTDAWGIDLLVVGSQKALLLPPGLGFVSVSPKAWKRIEQVDPRAFYLDLRAAQKSWAKGDTPYTPANTLIAALGKSLAIIREEGIENVWARHAKTAQAVRAAAEAIGLMLLSSSPADAVTAVLMPDGIDADEVRSILKAKYGLSVAGGQEHLKGKILRIGHLGNVDALDALGCIAALEMALVELGVDVQLGAGVAAAQKALLAD